MNRPMTDRERCLGLEARVAELEEELGAYRANERAAAFDYTAGAELWRLTELFRPLVPTHAALGARCLLYLAQRPGRLCPNWELGEAIAKARTSDPDRLAKIGVSKARLGLKRLAVPHDIKLVWGRGYLLERAGAAAVARLVAEPAHG